MDLLAVTLIAIGGEMGEGGKRSDLVPKRGVAVRAFDFVIGHVVFMDELGGVLCGQDHRFVVALHTFPFRDVGIPLDDTEMTFLAGYPSLNVLSMIEAPALDFDVPLGLRVAGSATAHRTGNAFLLPPGSGLVVVADETVGVVNGKMGALNNLGMAGRASECNSPPQITSMLFMGEGYILINHIFLEFFDLMASLLEATRVVDLRVRHAWPLP